MVRLARWAVVWRVRVVGGIAVALATALAAATVVELARQSPITALERGLPTGVLVLGSAAVCSTVAGAWLSREAHPSAAAGLAVATVGLVTPVWAGFTWLSPDARSAALATAPLAVAGVAHVVLRWTPCRRPHLLLVVYALAGTATAVHLAGYDPFEDLGCTRTCVDTTPVASGFLATRSAQAASGALTVVAGVLAVVGCARARRAGVPTSVIIGALVSAPLLALAAGFEVFSDASRSISADVRVAVSAAAGLALGAGTSAAGLRLRRVRLDVERLVADLSSISLPERASSMVDEVRFAVPGRDGWIDVRGRPTSPPPAGAVLLSDAAGPVLGLPAERRTELPSVGARSRASWLALRNAHLAALTRARVVEVQASRQRICSASDAERLRIERDLHDGAQQRLVTAAFHLSLARARLSHDAERVARAEEGLRDALAELRRLTRGLFPSLLITDGLRAALEELVRDGDVPATLEADALDEVPRDAAMAVYAMVAAALEHEAAGSPAAVRVDVARPGSLVVSVSIEHPLGVPDPLDYTDVDDRIGAAGGRLAVTRTRDNTTVTAEIPCGS